MTFCGPRFPSLERDEADLVTRTNEDILPRIADKKKIESLRELTEEQLKQITALEGDIHETIYQTRDNQPPCSLLANHSIMAASQCPQLLPGNTKEKIKSMKEILDLMETKKHDHLETLRWLQRQPHQKVKHPGHDNNSNSGWDDEEDDEEDDDDDDNAQAQHGHRASDRLANKHKINYKEMHKRGFKKDY